METEIAFGHSRMRNSHVILGNLIVSNIFMFQFKQFNCSFNIGIEIGGGRGGPLQLISLEPFPAFVDYYS